jgi:hypothetical protein
MRNRKPLATIMVAVTQNAIVTCAVVDDGDPSLYLNGQKVLPDRPTTPEGRRQWALNAALKFAASRPDLNLSQADIEAGAEKFLAWLEKGKPSPKPSEMAAPEML